LAEGAPVVLEALTPEEQRRHEKAIAKLRAGLFAKHPASHYFIVPGTEKVLPASCEGKWMQGEGSYRVLHLGGLEYSLDCADPDGHTTLSIRHHAGSLFWFWIVAAKGFTLTAGKADFKDLARSVRSSITACLVENWWSVFCQRYKPPEP
jgi:hypothetical protein